MTSTIIWICRFLAQGIFSRPKRKRKNPKTYQPDLPGKKGKEVMMGEMPDIFQSSLNNELNDFFGASEGVTPALQGLLALEQIKETVQKSRKAIKDRENDLVTDDSVNKLCEKIEYLSLGLETFFKNQSAGEPMNIDKRTAEVIAACLDEKLWELKLKWYYLRGGLGVRPNPATTRHRP
jgi:hypothetical protein